MMSEICMKGRLILSRVRKGVYDCSPDELRIKLDSMEAEMQAYAEKLRLKD